MKAEDFIPAVGKYEDAPEVVKLLKSLGVKKVPPLRGSLYAYVQLPKKGLVLVFRESNDPKASRRLLGAVQIYTQAEKGFVDFPGALPSGLVFADTRLEVKKKLGKPTKAKALFRQETWARKGYNLNVQYTRDTGQIESIDFSIPV